MLFFLKRFFFASDNFFLFVNFTAAQAESLIRGRLEVTPGEARLWCALGDLNLDDSCYQKAWEVSVGALPELLSSRCRRRPEDRLLRPLKCMSRPFRGLAELYPC